MFTINLEDGREAPSKARKKGAKRLEFLVYLQFADTINLQIYFSFYRSTHMLYTKIELFLRKESSRMLKIHVNKYKRANILCANLHYPGDGTSKLKNVARKKMLRFNWRKQLADIQGERKRVD